MSAGWKYILNYQFNEESPATCSMTRLYWCYSKKNLLTEAEYLGILETAYKADPRRYSNDDFRSWVTSGYLTAAQYKTITGDNTAPVITLNGDATVNIAVGAAYTDAGATAIDALDGAVTVTTSGTVDASKAGTYTITYTAVDYSGNTVAATRTVVVAAPASTQSAGK